MHHPCCREPPGQEDPKVTWLNVDEKYNQVNRPITRRIVGIAISRRNIQQAGGARMLACLLNGDSMQMAILHFVSLCSNIVSPPWRHQLAASIVGPFSCIPTTTS